MLDSSLYWNWFDIRDKYCKYVTYRSGVVVARDTCMIHTYMLLTYIANTSRLCSHGTIQYQYSVYSDLMFGSCCLAVPECRFTSGSLPSCDCIVVCHIPCCMSYLQTFLWRKYVCIFASVWLMLGDSVAVLPQIVTGTSILIVNTGLVKVVLPSGKMIVTLHLVVPLFQRTGSIFNTVCPLHPVMTITNYIYFSPSYTTLYLLYKTITTPYTHHKHMYQLKEEFLL
jgi:hypothetical protein